MAKTTPQAGIEMTLDVTLTEAEVRALEALMGYGFTNFRDFFYEHMGSHYMKPNEAGLKSLFDTLQPQLQMALSRVDAARKAFDTGRYEVRERAKA